LSARVNTVSKGVWREDGDGRWKAKKMRGVAELVQLITVREVRLKRSEHAYVNGPIQGKTGREIQLHLIQNTTCIQQAMV
jgi:hypothetical protein